MLKRILFAVLMLCAFAAQATVYSLPWGPKPQFVDANGAPMSSGTLSFFAATTTTPQNTYTDSTGGVANANPLTLNTRGESPNEIWLQGGLTYKVVLKDSSGVTVWTIDNISGINDVTQQTGNEWTATGLTPTFVSATSFTVTGDQTLVFEKGRRLKTTNTAGTVYAAVTNAVFGAGITTVTVAERSGSLDAGLSAVSVSLVSVTNTSITADAVNRRYPTSIASAATTDIWSVDGDLVALTGTATITSFGTCAYAGNQRVVVFNGAMVLTHSASLLLPGSQNITTATGDLAVIRCHASTSVMRVISFTRLLGTGGITPRSYLAGCTMSTAGASATMTIAACQATDSTNAVLMNLTSSLAKTTSAWAVGAANGCLDTGAIANTTWYHFYEIMRSDTGVVDVLCSLSASAPTMPTSYTFARRLGAGLTNGSAQWVAFSQIGDEFLWSASVLDVNANNPGAAAVSRTLTVPTNVQVWAIVNWGVINAGAGVAPFGYISSLDQSDETPSGTVAPLANAGIQVSTGAGNAATQGSWLITRTNTSAQVRSRLSASDANVTLRGATLGWRDRRGQDN